MKSFLPILLFTASLAMAGDPPDFSRYPEATPPRDAAGHVDPAELFSGKGPGFRYYVRAHLDGHFQEFRRRPVTDEKSSPDPTLLAITYIKNGGQEASDYFVSVSGFAYTCHDIYGWAVRGIFHQQLTAEQLATVRDQITRLPTANVYPSIDQLVVVSFLDGDAWTTRTCRAEDVASIQTLLDDRLGVRGSPRIADVQPKETPRNLPRGAEKRNEIRPLCTL